MEKGGGPPAGKKREEQDIAKRTRTWIDKIGLHRPILLDGYESRFYMATHKKAKHSRSALYLKSLFRMTFDPGPGIDSQCGRGQSHI